MTGWPRVDILAELGQNLYSKEISKISNKYGELLHFAKLKHSKLYGDDKPIDRVKIRRFRKEMRK